MSQDLLKLAAETLKKAALNEEAKHFILGNEKLYTVLKKAANRYIGGETLAETVSSIRQLNDAGYGATTDYMGESVRSEKEANEATFEFIRLAQKIKSENLNSSISLDLSHIGLLVSRDLAKQNLQSICEQAATSGQEVIISMEGTDRTDHVLDVYTETLKKHPNVGITVQAYLHRTKEDFKYLLKLSGSIRIVKGAYETPAELSIPRGNDLDEIYLDYVQQLLAKNHRCAIASHDEKIHGQTIKLIDKYQPTAYVLERLLGICNDELQAYKDADYKCRIYVVYGKEWYLYLCNRWAEHPLNVFRGLADMVG